MDAVYLVWMFWNGLFDHIRASLIGGGMNLPFCCIEIKSVIADRAFDSDELCDQIEKMGRAAVIPPKANRKQQYEYDTDIYQ